MDAEKYGVVLPVSRKLIEDYGIDLTRAMEENARMTPAEREARIRRMAEERKELREHSPRIPLDVAALEDKMGWKRGFVEHLMQPYCTCGVGYDGWDHCEHATDLGLAY
jgi:hypothetical protein